MNKPLLMIRLISLALIATSFAVPSHAEVINEDLKILANDGQSGDSFGISMDIDSGKIAIGAFVDDDNANNSGSAYVFNAVTGAQITKLLPSDGEETDLFGQSLAIEGNTVVVTSRKDDDNGLNSGSAYIFNATTGAQLFKLLAYDGDATDNFGGSVAIDNGIIAIGAADDEENGNDSGSVYLFNASTGEQIYKLIPSDGVAYSHFGFSLAIDNGVLAVGAMWDDENGSNSGSVYLFDISTGNQLAKLMPDDGAPNDAFGYSVSMDNGLIAIGVWRDNASGYRSGSAYVFDVATGDQVVKLIPNDGASEDEFGKRVDLDNGVVVVGAWMDDDFGPSSGSAYIFSATTGAQIAKLLPSDATLGHYFGVSVAIDNGVVAAGAHHDGDNGALAGAAYTFNIGNVGIEDTIAQQLDTSLTLWPNHPNPFNPTTTISFTLETPGNVELAVYSARGERVRSLVSGWRGTEQDHTVIWDGRDDHGRAQPSGVYYSRLQCEGMSRVQKMMLMK